MNFQESYQTAFPSSIVNGKEKCWFTTMLAGFFEKITQKKLNH